MSRREEPLNFISEEQRRSWMTANADYFTVWLRVGNNITKDLYPTLAKAERAAQRLVRQYPTRVVMIYAVKGVHDVWVKNVKMPGA